MVTESVQTELMFIFPSNVFLGLQMQLVVDLIKEENRLRNRGGLTNTSDVFSRLHQGRRIPVKLGKRYPAVVLDAKSNAEPPALRCGVFLVPKVIFDPHSESWFIDIDGLAKFKNL